MAKQEPGTFWGGLTEFSVYKSSQGRLARQLTAAALGIILASGAYVLSVGPLMGVSSALQKGIPLAILVLGGWFVFRLVNFPRFAEFLISVEAEMGKVSWAPRAELIRATIVVLSTMAFLGIVLFAYDMFWQTLFQAIGVLPSAEQ
jgi:preprotein translocase subunit SecE